MPRYRRSRIIDTLHKYCRWCSVRGVSHAARNEGKPMKTVWSLFIISMVSCTIYSINELIIRYYKYNTFEKISVVKESNVSFPAITICNVNPIDQDRLRCLINESLLNTSSDCSDMHNHRNILPTMLKLFNLTSGKSQLNLSLIDYRSRSSILYQMIGKEAASAISHQLKQFILMPYCEIAYQEQGESHVVESCEKAKVVFKPLVSYQFYNCYNVYVSDILKRYKVTRLTMVVYINEEDTFNCRPYCTHKFADSVGAKMQIHRSGIFPFIEEESYNLAPGFLNKILVKDIRITDNLEYGILNCKIAEEVKADTYSIVGFSLAANNTEEPFQQNFTYTSDLCIQLKYQNLIMNECNCIDALLAVAWSDRFMQLPFCGNASMPDVNTKLECRFEIKRKFATSIYLECPRACRQVDYLVEVSQLIWPRKTQIIDYYDSMKRVSPEYNEKFSIYEQIEAESINDSIAAYNRLLATNIFERNFLKVEIDRPSFYVIRQVEAYEYTVTTFISQIGGICGIFMGINLATFVEWFELSVRLFNACRRKRKTDETLDTIVNDKIALKH